MKARFLLAVLLMSCAAKLPAADKPDVLFIAVDDLNDWVTHLGGHPQAKTPNIDRLVARGTVFSNTHCAAPACNPSRAALMSGLRPWQTGIYMNDDLAAGVMKNTVTINRHLKDQGYNTQGGGKIYHNFSAEGRPDTWTDWKGLFPSAGGHEMNMNGLKNGHFDWGPLNDKPEDMGDYKLTTWAVDQLKNAPADQPLFLAVGYVKPHLPWYVPQEYFDRFPLEEIQLPAVKADDLADVPAEGIKMAKPEGDHARVVEHDQWKKAVQAYLATISFLDDQVGRLLDGLDASPRKDKTIIVWWTDHGWALGEKQHWRKFALWEETTRTSCAIVAPGLGKAGTESRAPVDYMSMYPTLCDLTGVPLPAHVKGRSLKPLLEDPASSWDGVAICTHGRGNHGVRDAEWRYIRYKDGGEELYNHTSDPNEWKNLANDPAYAPVKARLAVVLPVEEVPPVPENRRGKDGKKKGKAKGKGQSKEQPGDPAQER